MRKRTKQVSSRKMRRVLLYCGGDPVTTGSSFFFLNLFWKVLMQGRNRGLEIIPIFDSRPPDFLDTIPPEVSSILDDGDIEGIVGIMLYESMVGWMKGSGLPYSALFESGAANHLDFDHNQMIDVSFSRLSELGCKSVGLMIPTSMAQSELLEHMDEVARRLDLEVNYEWILVSRKSRSLSGYNHFQSLWALKRAPDGLVVFPDVTARGVVTALLERNVVCPDQLKVIFHRNDDSPYAVPMPCDWVENSTAAMAEALIGKLEAQWEKRELEQIRLPFRLVKGF